MKSLLISAIIFCVISLGLYAQCTPNAPTDTAGLTPVWTSSDLKIIVPGEPYHQVIHFENFTTVGGLAIDSLRLDSIAPQYLGNNITNDRTGIPKGISYTTNLGDTPVTWYNGETGCIVLSGNADIGTTLGNWKMGMYITLWVQGIGEIGGDPYDTGFFPNNNDPNYYLKVWYDTTTYPDSLLCDYCQLDVGINETTTISNLSIIPNPFTSSAVITFNSKVAGNYKAILTDIVGKEVEVSNLDIIMGQNQINIDRGNLPNGMYLYTITNGKQSISKRLVIQN